MNTELVKSYIAQGKTKEAINILLSQSKNNTKLANEIRVLNSSYEEIMSQKRKGLLSSEDSLRFSARINNSLLELVDRVNLNIKLLNHKKKSTSIRKTLIVSLFLTITIILIINYFSLNTRTGNNYEETTFNDNYPIDTTATGFTWDKYANSISFPRAGLKNSDLIKKTDEMVNETELSYRNSISVYNLEPNLTAYEYFKIGKAFKEAGEFNHALLNFSKAILDSTDFVSAYIERGIIKRLKHNYEEALDDYTTAIKIYPNYPIHYINRGIVYFVLGENEKALQDCNSSININSNIPEAYNCKGNVLISMKSYKKALKQYNLALKLKPMYGHALHGRGFAKLLIKDSQGIRFKKNQDIGCSDWEKALKLGVDYSEEMIKNYCKE